MISVNDVTAIINQLLPEPHAGLLSGILYGAKASIYPELKQALIRSGTLHIIALSGMNITILCNLTALSLLSFFSRRIANLLTIVIIIGFVFFVGPSPSVVRAALMGCLALLSTTFGRQRHALYLLILVGLIMISFDPKNITNISFQLSFLATLGIILFGRSSSYEDFFAMSSSKKMLPLIWFFIKNDIRTTLSAQVFTLPIFIFQFHRISLLAPLTNLLIGSVIPPLTVVGLLLSVIGLFWLPLAIPLSWIAWVFLEYLLQVVFFVSALPFSSIEI